MPKEKRVFGYFALPVLVGDEIVAAIDLKTDREKKKLLIQNWTWVGPGSEAAHKRLIEEELHRFEALSARRRERRGLLAGPHRWTAPLRLCRADTLRSKPRPKGIGVGESRLHPSELPFGLFAAGGRAAACRRW